MKDFIDRPGCAEHQNIDKFIDALRDCDLYVNDADQYAVIAPENQAFDCENRNRLAEILFNFNGDLQFELAFRVEQVRTVRGGVAALPN